MSIRSKIVLVFIPLLITPLLLTAVASTLSARNGVTAVATSFLRFKSEELINYASGQWSLLVENRLAGDAAYVNVAKEAVAGFARGLIRSDTELIVAIDGSGRVAMSTADVTFAESEIAQIQALAETDPEAWHTIGLGGLDRVAQTVRFEPFDWFILVTESQATFYRSVNQILTQTGIILTATLAVSLVLLLIFTHYITSPLRTVADTMQNIITTNDLSQRVEILYNDETGRVGHTFNKMILQIDMLNEDLKEQYYKAYRAAKNEQKVRLMFQKYVPQDVIDQFFEKPEEMLVGRQETLVILFSDVRDFTAISESEEFRISPDDLVQSLNHYFDPFVDIIQKKYRGIVDKFIGDAIMAIFGAPKKTQDEAERSVAAALDMIDAMPATNAWFQQQGRKPWNIGIGINYGLVTIGNIGSEQKMDYTVIGDAVNEASRLEGLTKKYKVPIIVSHRIQRYCVAPPRRSQQAAPRPASGFRFRLLDKVRVKGKADITPIYQPTRNQTEEMKRGWDLYDKGVNSFLDKSFADAKRLFREALKVMPDDWPTTLYLSKAEELESVSALAEGWDVTVMDSK